MPKKKSTGKRAKASASDASVAKAASRNTASGPAHPTDASPSDPLAQKAADTETLASAVVENPNKPGEFGRAGAINPPTGFTVEPPSPDVGASTLTERNASDKVGSGDAITGVNPLNESARSRARRLRRPRAHDQSGRAGRRQPELAEGRPARADAARRLHPAREDHALRPRAHSRAHRARARLRRARLLRVLRAADRRSRAPRCSQEAGKRTPVFVRFSTVAGERGSTDTARDVRGFAVKFYTDEGNWDLVGNNIPVFFIQDAMKFPDLVHAVKPEPHHAHAAGGVGARHVLGFRLADARIDAHADVGDVGSRDPAQLSHDAGLRRAHLPPRQRSRRVARS